MACASTCASTLTPYSNCAPNLRKQTGKRLAAYKCDYVWTNIQDSAEWITAIGTGDVVYTPAGTIAKAPGSPNFVQVTHNRRALDNIENTLTFRTYDTKDDLTDFDFWNTVMSDAHAWVIGWLDDEDRFYELEGADVFSATDLAESAPTATSVWQAVVTYNSLTEVKPVIVAGLADAIDAL